MRILAIGNSFSEDACRYIHRLAKADGRHVHTANLYIGGCSLDHHYRNMMGDKQAYTLQFNGESTGFQVSISEALLSGRWDAITIQQASHYSARKETYQPYATQLAEYIRKYAPRPSFWCMRPGRTRRAAVAFMMWAGMKRRRLCTPTWSVRMPLWPRTLRRTASSARASCLRS